MDEAIQEDRSQKRNTPILSLVQYVLAAIALLAGLGTLFGLFSKVWWSSSTAKPRRYEPLNLPNGKILIGKIFKIFLGC